MDYIRYIKEVLVPLSAEVHKFMDSTRIISDNPDETKKNIAYLRQRLRELNRYWDLSKLVMEK